LGLFTCSVHGQCAAGQYDSTMSGMQQCLKGAEYSEPGIISCEIKSGAPQNCTDDADGILSAAGFNCAGLSGWGIACVTDMHMLSWLNPAQPQGSFLNLTCPEMCKICPEETFKRVSQVSDINACTTCAPGELDHDFNPLTPCIPCSDGTYSDKSGSTSCVSCATRSQNNISVSLVLRLCTVGVCVEGATSCPTCARGHYDHDADEASPCVPCPTDTYQDEPGAVGCTACPEGRVSLPGSPSLDSCCAPGTHMQEAAGP
jgi:hypothetical protein